MGLFSGMKSFDIYGIYTCVLGYILQVMFINIFWPMQYVMLLKYFKSKLIIFKVNQCQASVLKIGNHYFETIIIPILDQEIFPRALTLVFGGRLLLRTIMAIVHMGDCIVQGLNKYSRVIDLPIDTA